MKPIQSFFTGIFLCALLCSTVTAVPQDDERGLKAAVLSKSFVFKANTARPIGGKVIQLTSQYDLRVSKDTIAAFLPYYGRAYSASLGNTDGGIQFRSTDFSYTSDTTKKGSWIIRIEPKNEKNVRQMILTITRSGLADLQVSSNNRQPISFSGTVLPADKYKR